MGRIVSLISIYFINDFLEVMHGRKIRRDKKYHTYVGEKKGASSMIKKRYIKD